MIYVNLSVTIQVHDLIEIQPESKKKKIKKKRLQCLKHVKMSEVV